MTSKEFAARLIAARQARGLTQAGAAQLLGIHRVTYVRHEVGKTMPSILVAWDLVEKMGADPRTIFPEFYDDEEAAR